ncbi:hypothetical protein EYS14_00155 [Alteromonadaceae bacterium M269]|nr:hypothetical protein EYS14_00155 [Alteromonadaceae bacterium M269]
MASDLTKTFGISTETPSGETLEELRQHYFTHANMRELDDTNVGGLRIQAGSRKHAADMERKKQQATSDFLLIEQLTKQLENLTDEMASKYTKGFAAQFAAPLLDTETFERINRIQDIDKRREAFARAINEGIKSGTIDEKEAYSNPDFADWLRKHDEVEAAKSLDAKLETQLSEASHNNATDNDLSAGIDKLFTDNPAI